MTAFVLVTYTTRYGSTQEVAEAIAATLRTDTIPNNCVPMCCYRRLIFSAKVTFSRYGRISRFSADCCATHR